MLVGTGTRSTLEPSNDPWLAEQAYRVALQAANRHSEFYIKELGRLEDELIILGQKRAVVVMCSKKVTTPYNLPYILPFKLPMVVLAQPMA